MEMVEPQYEVLHVAEPIRLPFKGLDLVVESFGHGIADAVLEVVEKPCAVARQSLSHSGKHLDPGFSGILAPSFKEMTGTFRIGLLPKKSELLFHAVGREEGLIDREQVVEALLAIDTQIVVVLQKKEAAAFEGFLAKLIELPLLLSTELIDSLVDQRCHMVVVENDIHSGERFANSVVVGTAHVHGDGLEILGFLAESFQKGLDVLLCSGVQFADVGKSSSH